MCIEQIPTETPLKEHRILFNKAKLKAVSRTSALLSGFTMVAMVETSLGNYKQPQISILLITSYSILTCLVVGVHLIALMISLCILGVLEADDVLDYEEHRTMYAYIERVWILSSGFGIFLFLLEISIVCWIKFFIITRPAAIATTFVILPFIVLFFIFSLHFYRRLVIIKLRYHQNALNQIEQRLMIRKLPAVSIV